MNYENYENLEIFKFSFKEVKFRIMKRGKTVFAVLMILSVLIVSAIGVNAGWFGKSTGNAAKDVTANVKITSSSVAPEIVYVSPPNRTYLDAEAGSNYFSFTFLAYSSAGTSFLPVAAESARILGDFNGTYGGLGQQKVNAASCTTVSDTPINCIRGTSACINYTCNVRLYYYYDPAVNGWGINASVIDDSGKIGNNHSVSFTLADFKAFDRNPTFVNWTGVTVGGSVKASDNNVNVNLTGNKDINSGVPLQINATTLYKVGDPSKTIEGDNFTSPAIAPCTGGVNLLPNQQYVSTGTFFSIDHTTSLPGNPADKDLLFCIKTLVNIETGEYDTDVNKKWQLYVGW